MRLPDLSLEQAAWAEGYRLVAGIDEVGRGAWAGPVAAAAVVFPSNCPDLQQRLDGVRDSKTLSPRQRERLFEIIQREAVAIGVGMIGPEVIVRDGITAANRGAMAQSIQALRPEIRPDFLLIDHVRLPQLGTPQKSIRKGDEQSFSIAAASIIAKVTRDRLMTQMAQTYPGYGFERHKGYGTRVHWQALQRHGIAPVHRRTWAPFLRLQTAGGPAEGA